MAEKKVNICLCVCSIYIIGYVKIIAFSDVVLIMCRSICDIQSHIAKYAACLLIESVTVICHC